MRWNVVAATLRRSSALEHVVSWTLCPVRSTGVTSIPPAGAPPPSGCNTTVTVALRRTRLPVWLPSVHLYLTLAQAHTSQQASTLPGLSFALPHRRHSIARCHDPTTTFCPSRSVRIDIRYRYTLASLDRLPRPDLIPSFVLQTLYLPHNQARTRPRFCL